MKKLLLIALLALPVSGCVAQAKPAKKQSAKSQVKWLASFPAALAQAKRTGQPIFVDFYTTWCGPCKYLEAVTYKDARFVAESRKWVMVKINPEKNAANLRLAQKYKVDGFPSLLFLQPGGKESSRIVGGYPPAVLVPKMKRAGQKASGSLGI